MKYFKNQKKISLFLLTIFLLVFVYWVLETYKPTPLTTDLEPSDSPSNIISGIARVIDGDTIAIEDSRIRLSKIDAPEMKQKCLDKKSIQYLCGEVSKAFLKKMIDGKQVVCSYEERDMYNRYLGTCTTENININYELVKNGMAVIYNQKDADLTLKQFEIEAGDKRLGIWQGAFEEPKEYRRKNRKKRDS